MTTEEELATWKEIAVAQSIEADSQKSRADEAQRLLDEVVEIAWLERRSFTSTSEEKAENARGHAA